MHLGIASAIAVTRKNWCIPRLCPLLEKHIHDCNVCKVFVTRSMKPSTTASSPNFRLEAALLFQQTGVDFAGPLVYRKKDKPEQKAYIVIFTSLVTKAVHLKTSKLQGAGESQSKLKSFIRNTRSNLIV